MFKEFILQKLNPYIFIYCIYIGIYGRQFKYYGQALSHLWPDVTLSPCRLGWCRMNLVMLEAQGKYSCV